MHRSGILGKFCRLHRRDFLETFKRKRKRNDRASDKVWSRSEGRGAAAMHWAGKGTETHRHTEYLRRRAQGPPVPGQSPDWGWI